MKLINFSLQKGLCKRQDFFSKFLLKTAVYGLDKETESEPEPEQ